MSVRHRRRKERRRVHLHQLPAAPLVDLALVQPYVDRRERTEDGMFVCQDCRHHVRALVDDGPLCIRCDALRYPYDPPARAS